MHRAVHVKRRIRRGRGKADQQVAAGGRALQLDDDARAGVAHQVAQQRHAWRAGHIKRAPVEKVNKTKPATTASVQYSTHQGRGPSLAC